ncbi:MAG: GDSL-type esterase/lipase family protein [Alphaproteobacteria bacterium]
MTKSKTFAGPCRPQALLLAALLGLSACNARATPPQVSVVSPPDATADRPSDVCRAAVQGAVRLEPIALAKALPPRRPAMGGDALAPFYDALAQTEARRAGEPLSIVVLGDSHTAGPYFAGRLRERFQERFGSAGPGAMPPGQAQRGYRNARVEIRQTGTWTGASSLRTTTPGPFGLALHRLRSDEPGSTITATAQEPAGFEKLEASVVRFPDAGAVRVLADGCPLATIATAGGGGASRLVASLPPHTVEVALETVDGPVELLGWRLTRGRGAVLESHGVNGAQMSMLGNLDPEILAGELRSRDPALIIVAFGTNEAFSTDLTEQRYRASLEERLGQLRRAAPRAAVLVVGPPDSAIAARPAPGRKGRRPAGCGWGEPPNLAMVKSVQRRVAHDLGLPYWDWSRLTKGACGVNAMARRDPPLAYRDRVHFTADGYAQAADALFRFLMDGYAKRRRVS